MGVIIKFDEDRKGKALSFDKTGKLVSGGKGKGKVVSFEKSRRGGGIPFDKGGEGNPAWKRALAKATAGKEFKETREAVLKMMMGRKIKIVRSGGRRVPKIGSKAKSK